MEGLCVSVLSLEVHLCPGLGLGLGPHVSFTFDRNSVHVSHVRLGLGRVLPNKVTYKASEPTSFKGLENVGLAQRGHPSRGQIVYDGRYGAFTPRPWQRSRVELRTDPG